MSRHQDDAQDAQACEAAREALRGWVERQETPADLLSARRSVEAHLARAPQAERGLWRQQLVALDARLAQHDCAMEAPRPPGLRAHPALAPGELHVHVLLIPGGEELVLARLESAVLFVERVAVKSGEARQAALVALPAPLSRYDLALVEGALRLVGYAEPSAAAGQAGPVVAELSLGSWELSRWDTLTSLLPPGLQINTALSAGPRHVWIRTFSTPDDREGMSHVIDLEREQAPLQLSGLSDLHVVPRDGAEPLVAGVDPDGGPQLFRADGRPLRGALPRGAEPPVAAVAPRPDGAPGLLGLIEAWEADDALRLTLLDPDGRAGPALALQGSTDGYRNQVACALDDGLVFIAHHAYVGRHVDRVLSAVRPRGEALELVWRVQAPQTLALVRDEASRRVVALTPEPEGVKVLRLGAAPPRVEQWREPWDRYTALQWPHLRLAPGGIEGWLEGDGGRREARAQLAEVAFRCEKYRKGLRPGVAAALERWFEGYVAEGGFLELPGEVGQMARLKLEHTRRVVQETAWLAKQLPMVSEQRELAGLIALLHDVGRFEQLARHGTINDRLSENHAVLGLKVLQREGVLARLGPWSRRVVGTAIGTHNHMQLRRAVREGQFVSLYARLLRDADKLDIWQVFIDTDRAGSEAMRRKVFADLPEVEGVSPGVAEAVAAGQRVEAGALRGRNDVRLMVLSWVFDLNFACARVAVKQRGYLEALAERLPDVAGVRAALETARAVLEEGLKEKRSNVGGFGPDF
jgi:HD domain